MATVYPDAYIQMLKNIQDNANIVKQFLSSQLQVKSKSFYENKLKQVSQLYHDNNEKIINLALIKFCNKQLSTELKIENLVKQIDNQSYLTSPSLSDPAAFSPNASSLKYCSESSNANDLDCSFLQSQMQLKTKKQKT